MIQCKSSREVELIRKAGEITAGALRLLAEMLKPDISTKSLDETAVKYIKEKGGVPAFKGYRGFPANICVSVNEEVVHGIPDKRRLLAGDIVSIDIGVCYKNYYADAAITEPVGNVSGVAEELIRVTENALALAIKKVRSEVRLSEISRTIQDFVEGKGFSVVRELVGHGIGSEMHEEPQIPNYVDDEISRLDNEVILKEGMILAIEPMVNQGTYQVETLSNGWTVVTRDRKLSAHFEHTIVVKKGGCEILTF